MSQNILLEGGRNIDFDSPYSYASGKRRKKRDAKKAERAKRREAKRIRRLQRRKEGKGFFQKVLKGIKRFNPLSTTVRAGTLAAARINLFGMATRLYPAFLSDAEIKKRKFKKDNAGRAKIAWKKTADFWENKLGGKAKNLESAIKNGFDKPIFRRKKKTNFVGDGLYTERTTDMPEGLGWQYADALFEQIEGADGKPSIDLMKTHVSQDEIALMGRLMGDLAYPEDDEQSNVTGADDAAILGVIASAMPVIAVIVNKFINGSGVDKNPYERDSTEGEEYADDLADAEKEGEMTTPAIDETQLAKIEKAGEEDAKKGGEDEDQLIAGVPNTAVYIGGGLLGLGLFFWGLSAVLKKTKGK